MNLSAINSALGFGRGANSLPKLPDDQEWACDNGVDGPYPRKKLERTPKTDAFEHCECPQCETLYRDEPRPGYHFDYTEDNRRIEVPNYRG